MAVPQSPPRRELGAPVRWQYAALPWRRTVDGRLEVLLITSRETRRWVIPKGWPIADLAPHLSAAQEALEEAGVRGKSGAAAIGGYAYEKRLKSGRIRHVEVEVFPLKVVKERRNWREKRQRAKEWFTPEAAAARVDEPALRALILRWAAEEAQRKA